MLIISEHKDITLSNELPKKLKTAKKLKTKCCKKYKKDNRCKRCPCYDMIKKAS